MADKTIIIEGAIPIWLQGTPKPEDPDAVKLTLKTLGDGTLKTYSLMVGRDSNLREAAVLIESDNSQVMTLQGWDGSALRRLRTETTGELRNSLFGKNPAAALEALLTDNQGMFRNRPIENAIYEGPKAITTADVVLYQPAVPYNTASYIHHVWVNVVNNGVASATVEIAQGSMAFPNYWVKDERVPYRGDLGWRYFFLAGNGNIHVRASANNTLAVDYRILITQTGDNLAL